MSSAKISDRIGFQLVVQALESLRPLVQLVLVMEGYGVRQSCVK